MDISVLIRIAAELEELLTGGFVNKIHQPLPREIVVRVRAPRGGEQKLMISADPRLGRIHITERRIPNPPAPPLFCAYLRAHFQGVRISRIEAAADDRIVRIYGSRGPETAREERVLILELLGRDSNIILVDSKSGLIMGSLHRIPEKPGFRAVAPGVKYEPPPLNPRPKSPGKIVSHGRPGIAENPRPLVTDADPGHDQVFSSMNEAADALYSPRIRTAMDDALRREVSAPLVSKLKSLDRRTAKILADAERLSRYETEQECGELIKANLFRIKKGLREITVNDWEGNPRTIVLNPALDPVSNMNAFFRRGAKGKRGRSKVAERLMITQEEKRALQDRLYFIETATDTDEIERLAAEDTPKPKQSGRRPEPPRPEPSFLTHVAPSGARVFVGKSARGNDALLRAKSSKGNVWLHVKDMPGAHVVLAPENRSVTPEDIAYAAALAVEHSHARGKGKQEVMVADITEVSRIKGESAGRVRVRSFSVTLSEGLIAQ